MSGIDLNKILDYAVEREIEIKICVDGIYTFNPSIKIRMTRFSGSWPFTVEDRVSGIVGRPEADQERMIMIAIEEMYQRLRKLEQDVADDIAAHGMMRGNKNETD